MGLPAALGERGAPQNSETAGPFFLGVFPWIPPLLILSLLGRRFQSRRSKPPDFFKQAQTTFLAPPPKKIQLPISCPVLPVKQARAPTRRGPRPAKADTQFGGASKTKSSALK